MSYKFATFGLFIVHDFSGDPDLALRDSLTVLAILLICLLTAALVAPYFIDWSAHRGLIEAKLSEAAGTRITVAGPIRIRLLPQPTFRLAQVTIGDTAPGQQSLTAAELDVDIALTALMRGDLQVGEAVLRSPRLDLALGADGAVNIGLRGLGHPQRVQFDHVVVKDGTLNLARPGQPMLTVSGLDFFGEATSLLGPFKAVGQFGPADDPHGFRLSTGAFEAGKLRVKLGLDATKRFPATDFDGAASPGAGGSPKPHGPNVEGLLTLEGNISLNPNPATIPWVLTGHIQADGDRATAQDLEWRAGTDMRALSATGTGELLLGAAPRATLRLHGPLLNLDRLAVAPDQASVLPPHGLALLSSLNERLAQTMTSGLPLGLDLDYSFDTLTTGPLTVLGIAGHLGLDGATGALVRMEAHGPAGASVALDGRLEGGTAPVFHGRLTSSTRDLPGLADWLAPVLPDAAAWAKATIPARAVALDGTVDLSGVGVAARDAVIRLDRSQMAGTLTFTRAVGNDRARLFADLTSDALNLDDLPDLGGAAAGFSDIDLDLALAARAMKVAPAGIGAVDAGEIALRLHKTAATAVLDNFSAALGSARVTATGRLDPDAAIMNAHVDAPQIDALAALLGRIMPGTLSKGLSARAANLSPAQVDLGLRAARSADGSLLPTSLMLDGMLNGTRVKATLDPDAPSDLDPATALVAIDLTAEGPHGLTLLRQIGFPSRAATADEPTLGEGRLKAKAHGSAAEGFQLSVDGSLGGTILSFQGRTKSDHGGGHLAIKGGDLAPMLRAGGLAPSAGAWRADAEADLTWHDSTLAFRHVRGTTGPIGFSGDLDAALGMPTSNQPEKPVLFGALAFDRLSLPALLDMVLGPAPRREGTPAEDSANTWSPLPFGPPLLAWPRSEIAIKAGSLALTDKIEAHDASFTFRTARGAVTFADVTGKLRSGSLGGSLTLRRDGPLAAVNGTASWSGLQTDWPGLSGRFAGALDFGGSGETPAALVADLAGTGSITIADGRIARLDPAAMTRTAQAAEKNLSDVDADQIAAMVVPELDHAPLRLGDVAGQATLAAGVFRIGPLRAVSDEWTADADAALDLKTMDFSSKTVLKVRRPLPDWKGESPQLTLLLAGPLDTPRRDVDATGFVNALQSRAIARDQERIDAMQQDIRERAFFNRRLKSIEAEQAAAREKLQAEDAAKAAESEIMRQMRQNPEPSRPATPVPLSRPTGLSGGKPMSVLPGATARSSKTLGLKAPPIILDPSSAGRY